MNENSKKFLYEYLNNASPTGFEASGQQIWLDYMKPYIDETIIDTYGTAVGVIKGSSDYKVVIEAHADEISWFVNYIDDNGYIYVIRNGGSDHVIAPSMRVHLHTKKGKIDGVFGWPAIHVRKSSKVDDPTPQNIFIDVGAANKKEVEDMGIHVGTVATFIDGLMELNDRYFVGRALDNRLGGFIIAEVARMLKENNIKLPFTLYVVNSVQEEIGLRGAEMISRRLKPNLAICTDVTHDTHSPMYNKKEQGDIKAGNGPVLTFGPSIHNIVLDNIIELAKQKNINYQLSAASYRTGTDTDAFAYSSEGIASALVSIPLKYMHTTVETVHRDDISQTINLLYEVINNISAKENYNYLK
jgi:putative aminopeptidase FrvX